MSAILFRGLVFDRRVAAQEIETIRLQGFPDSAKRASNTYGIRAPTRDALTIQDHDFKNEIWDRELFPPFACADIRSASRYATGGRQNEQGVVVRIELDPSQIYVDGRDFLFYSFQRVDRWVGEHRSRELMKEAFGPRILEWAERAALERDGSDEDQRRINIACHACRDVQIIRAHLRSKLVLFGKANFYFCSAFRFNTPVSKDKISLVDPEPVWGANDLGLSFRMLGL